MLCKQKLTLLICHIRFICVMWSIGSYRLATQLVPLQILASDPSMTTAKSREVKSRLVSNEDELNLLIDHRDFAVSQHEIAKQASIIDIRRV